MPRVKWVLVVSIICLFLPANAWTDTTKSDSAADQRVISIQVSSFKKVEDAQKEVKRLKSKGLDVFFRKEPVKDKGMWHRVYVGQFKSKKEATAFANDLKKKGLVSWFWVKKTKAPGAAPQPVEEKAPATAATKKTPPPSAEVAPVAAAKPKPAEKKEVAKPKSKSERKKKAPSKKKKTKKDYKKSKFSLGLRPSVSLAGKAEDFKISRTVNGDVNSWSFGGTFVYLGLVADYRLSEKWIIEAIIEKDLTEHIDIWQFSLGPKYRFRKNDSTMPYARAGLVLGSLKWDDAPGDFDTGIGLEGGVGVDFIKSKLQFGLEATYRYLQYGYNKPSGAEYTVTDDSLDMSGLVFSGMFSYRF